MLRNSGFEEPIEGRQVDSMAEVDDINKWFVKADSWKRTAEKSLRGKHSIEIVDDNIADWPTTNVMQIVRASPKRRYKLNAGLYIDSMEGIKEGKLITPQIYLWFCDDSFTMIKNSAVYISAEPIIKQWQRVQIISQEAPEGTKYVFALLYSSWGLKSVLCWDDVKLNIYISRSIIIGAAIGGVIGFVTPVTGAWISPVEKRLILAATGIGAAIGGATGYLARKSLQGSATRSTCPVCGVELPEALLGVDVKCPECGFVSAWTRR